MANQRLNAKIQIGGTVARSLTKGLTDTKGQLVEVGSAIGKTTRRQKALSRQIETFGRQGRNVDGLRRQYAELGDELDRLRRKQEGLQRLSNANVGGRFATMSNEVGRLARNTTMLGGALAGGVFAVSNSTAELGDSVAKTADAIGIQIGKYQELRYAAERSGIGNFDSNMQAFTKRIGEAARGTGAAKDAIDELGLSAEALSNMTPDEALATVAERMKDIEDPTRRASLMADFFSRSGIKMINMLKDGRAGLEQYGLEARRTGNVLGDDTVRGAESFQDALLDTKMTIGGLKNTVGSALMPVVEDAMRSMSTWLQENRDKVQEWATTFATRLEGAIPAIVGLANGIGSMATTIGHAITTTADLVGGFDNLGAIIGTVIAGKAIVSIGMFGASLFKAGGALIHLAGGLPMVATGIKAIGTALMANPIGLVIGAIAGAAYLIYRNWDWIGPWFGKLWDGIKGAAAWAWDSLKTIVSWSPLGLIVRMWEPLTGWLGNVWNGIKADASAAWEWMKTSLSWSPIETVSSAWSGLTGWFGGLWDGITGAAERALNWITGKLEWVGGAFEKVTGWLGFGDDEETAAPSSRPQLGRTRTGPGPRVGASADSAANAQGVRADLPPRPSFNQQAAGAAERVREVVNNITNNLELHVTQRQGEVDEAFAERIAEMAMEKLNELQQGALYDG